MKEKHMANNPYMSNEELRHWEAEDMTTSLGDFTIKAKKDFGQYGYYDSKTRTNINAGWVIVKDHCNIMPGATWARTQDEALHMINCFIAVGEDAQKFWGLLRAIAKQIEPSTDWPARSNQQKPSTNQHWGDLG
jgi:hypothetical protein